MTIFHVRADHASGCYARIIRFVRILARSVRQLSTPLNASVERLVPRTLILALVLPACGARENSRDPAAESTAPAAIAEAPSWYSRARALDLDGDGRSDSVRLVAAGTQPDSLRITLTLFVGGAEKFQESWNSSYELALLDSATRSDPRQAAALRSHLDALLASVVVQRLDAPGLRLMKEDSVILAGLDPPPSRRVSFSYGYETTVRLVWDGRRARFVRLWSCC